MVKFKDLVKKVQEALERSGLRKDKYVVVGAIASGVWGRPRTTANIDIVIDSTPEINKQLVANLKELGFHPKKDTLKRLNERLPVKVWLSDKLSTDFKMKKAFLDEEAIRRAREFKFYGIITRIAPPEEMIAYKLYAYYKCVERGKRADAQMHLSDALKIDEKCDTNYDRIGKLLEPFGAEVLKVFHKMLNP